MTEANRTILEDTLSIYLGYAEEMEQAALSPPIMQEFRYKLVSLLDRLMPVYKEAVNNKTFYGSDWENYRLGQIVADIKKQHEGAGITFVKELAKSSKDYEDALNVIAISQSEFSEVYALRESIKERINALASHIKLSTDVHP